MGQICSKQRNLINAIEEYQIRIREFKPDNEFLRNNDRSDVVVIGMFGNTGVGKSSLINSMLSVIKETKHYTRVHVGSPEFEGGATVIRTPVDLTNYIRVVDNRGLDKIGLDGNVLQEIKAQIGKQRFFCI